MSLNTFWKNPALRKFQSIRIREVNLFLMFQDMKFIEESLTMFHQSNIHIQFIHILFIELYVKKMI